MKTGIKETKEVLEAVHTLSLFLINRFADGIDYQDAVAIWDKAKNDAVFMAKLQAAFDGYKQIPKETADLDVAETCEIIKMMADFAPAYITALRIGDSE